MFCAVPWHNWLAGLQHFRGIAHDKGFVPLESISYILHIDALTDKPFEHGGNVVPIKRAP